MGEDSGEKTEEPTPHKLREAREKGQIAKSKDLTSAFLVLVSFFTLKAIATNLWDSMATLSAHVFNQMGEEFTASVVGELLRTSLFIFLIAMAPLLLAIFITATIVELLQTGFVFSLSPLEPNLEKLNPIEGAKKFFSLKQYVELLKSMIKMTIVIWLIIGVIREEFILVILAQQLSLYQVMAFTGNLVMKVIIRVGIFYIIIGILDYMYQRYEHIKGLRMSKKEIKDEYKRLEGDPMIKQRQRDAQRQMAQGRQMGAVPGADVVVTNPIHIAIAIKYDQKENTAPVILAKGKRLVAGEIRRIAEESDVPIVENPPVARRLYDTDLNKEIATEHFRAVAEILAFVYNLKKKRRKTF